MPAVIEKEISVTIAPPAPAFAPIVSPWCPQPRETDAEILRRAAELFDEYEWCQFQWAFDEKGIGCGPYDGCAHELCMMGAILRAEHELYPGRPSKGASWSFNLGLATYQDSRGVAGGAAWNDSRDRKKSEVVERLRRAAEGEFMT